MKEPKRYIALIFLITLLASCTSGNKKFESDAEERMKSFESNMNLVSDLLPSMDVVKLFVEINKNRDLDTLQKYMHEDFVYVFYGKKRDKETFFSINKESARIMQKFLLDRHYSNYHYLIKGDSIEVTVNVSDWTIECFDPSGYKMKQTFLFEGDLIRAIVEEDVNDENEVQFYASLNRWANENEYVFHDENGNIIEDEFFKYMRLYCNEKKATD